MVKSLCFQAARGWFISEHDVEPVRLQLIDQNLDCRHTANDMNRFGKPDRRFEEFKTHQLGNRVRHSDI